MSPLCPLGTSASRPWFGLPLRRRRRRPLLLLQLLLVALLATVGRAAPDSQWNATLTRYNRLEKPRQRTDVHVNIYLRDLRQVDSDDQSFRAQITFRQVWTEPRLSHRHDTMPHQRVEPSLIWTPDTFFSNELEGRLHDLTRRNTLVRVKRNGEVLLSERMSLKLACPMSLAAFPFDTQVCSVYIASYGYTSDLLHYEWKENQPIQMNKQQLPADFELRQFNTSTCTARTTTGEYSCIRADFFLHRRWTHYMVQVFIPLTLLNVVAWLTFWLRDTAVRVTMLMFTLSLAVVGTAAVNRTLPYTSYAKMIDYFSGVALTFIFGALVEFVVVLRYRTEDDGGHAGADHHNTTKGAGAQEDGAKRESTAAASQIDTVARLVYATAYVGFLLVYSLAALLV